MFRAGACRALTKHCIPQLGAFKTHHLAAIAWAFGQLPHLQRPPVSPAALPSADAAVALPPTAGQVEEGVPPSAASAAGPEAAASSSGASNGAAIAVSTRAPAPPAEQVASAFGLWAAVAEAAALKVNLFKPGDLSATVWSLAQQGQQAPRLLDAAAHVLAAKRDDYSTSDVLELLAAAAAMHAGGIEALSTAAAEVLAAGATSATAKQLAAGTQLLAHSRCYSSQYLDAAARRLLQLLERHGLQHLAAEERGSSDSSGRLLSESSVSIAAARSSGGSDGMLAGASGSPVGAALLPAQSPLLPAARPVGEALTIARLQGRASRRASQQLLWQERQRAERGALEPVPLAALAAVLDALALYHHSHPRLLSKVAHALEEEGGSSGAVGALPPQLLAPLARALAILGSADAQLLTGAMLRRAASELGASGFTQQQLQQLFEAHAALRLRAQLAQQRELRADVERAAGPAGLGLAAGAGAGLGGGSSAASEAGYGAPELPPAFLAACEAAYRSTQLQDGPPAAVPFVLEVRAALQELAEQLPVQAGGRAQQRQRRPPPGSEAHPEIPAPRAAATPDSLLRLPLALKAGADLRFAVEPAGADAFALNAAGGAASAQPLAGPRLRWRMMRVLYGWRPVVVPEHEWQALAGPEAQQQYLLRRLGQAGWPGLAWAEATPAAAADAGDGGARGRAVAAAGGDIRPGGSGSTSSTSSSRGKGERRGMDGWEGRARGSSGGERRGMDGEYSRGRGSSGGERRSMDSRGRGSSGAERRSMDGEYSRERGSSNGERRSTGSWEGRERGSRGGERRGMDGWEGRARGSSSGERRGMDGGDGRERGSSRSSSGGSGARHPQPSREQWRQRPPQR